MNPNVSVNCNDIATEVDILDVPGHGRTIAVRVASGLSIYLHGFDETSAAHARALAEQLQRAAIIIELRREKEAAV